MWETRLEGSQVWKKMLQARDLIEHQILWLIGNGNAQFWFDNWTRIKALYNENKKRME